MSLVVSVVKLLLIARITPTGHEPNWERQRKGKFTDIDYAKSIRIGQIPI